MENLLVSCFLVSSATLNQGLEGKEAGAGVKGADNFLNILINKMGDRWLSEENQQILMFLQNIGSQAGLVEQVTGQNGSDFLSLTGQKGSPVAENIVGALLDTLSQRTGQAPQQVIEGNGFSSSSFLSFLQGGYLLYTGSAEVLLKGQAVGGTDDRAVPADKDISGALMSGKVISVGMVSDSTLSDKAKSGGALSGAAIQEGSEEKKAFASNAILSFLQGGYLLYTGSAEVLLKGQAEGGRGTGVIPPAKVTSDEVIITSIFRGKNRKDPSGGQGGQLESFRKEGTASTTAQKTSRNEFISVLPGTDQKKIDTQQPVVPDDLPGNPAEPEARTKVTVLSMESNPPRAAERSENRVEVTHKIDADLSVKKDAYQFISHDDVLKTGSAQEKEVGQVMGRSAFASVMVEKIEKLVDRFAQRDTSMDLVVRIRIDDKESLLVGLKEKGQTVTVQVKSGNEGLMSLLQSNKEIITRQLEEKNIYAKIWVNPDEQGGFEQRERRENRDGSSRQKDKGSENFSSQFASFA